METVYRKIKIEDRVPTSNKWVTVIDKKNNQFIARCMDNNYWNYRDVKGVQTPDDNLKLVYWLEEWDLAMLIEAFKGHDITLAVRVTDKTGYQFT